MNYKSFNEWELAQDPYFISWVLHPNEHSDKFWNQFVINHPEKAKEILLAKELVSNIKYGNNAELNEEEYVKLFEKILLSGRKIKAGRKSRLVKFFSSKNWVRYAAAILLACASWFLLEEFQSKWGLLELEKNVPILTKKSAEGIQLTTILNDGSKIKLNAGSKISYPKVFSDTLRQVYLVGEAYFEIVKDSSRPFRVVTQTVNTEVLGTSFNVMAYPDDDKINVSVAEGKVKVTNRNGLEFKFEHTLLPNESSEIDSNKKLAIKRQLEDDHMVFAWTEKKLVFKKESLSGVFRRLERWYGVEIVNRPIGEKLFETYSGSFDNDPLEVVLEALQSQGSFQGYSINRKKVSINYKN